MWSKAFQERKTILEIAKIRLKGLFLSLNQIKSHKQSNPRAHANAQKRRKESKQLYSPWKLTICKNKEFRSKPVIDFYYHKFFVNKRNKICSNASRIRHKLINCFKKFNLYFGKILT
jgi:hypothetical protein